jgi:hypothetical protein
MSEQAQLPAEISVVMDIAFVPHVHVDLIHN